MKKVFETLRNVWSVKDIRKKLLVTVFILALYRLGSQIPLPFIDAEQMKVFFNSQISSGSIFGYLNIISGNALGRGTLFALSISPYITASIVMQLLGVAFPKLGEMSKDEDGKKKVQMYTRYVTVGLSLITAFGYYMWLKNQSGLITVKEGESEILTAIVIIACYCAGASLIMWMGEKITQHGIGNGISMILFANIVSGGYAIFANLYSSLVTAQPSGLGFPIWLGLIGLVIAIAAALAMIWYMVYVSDSERRIPVQYAKRVVGRKMFGGQSSVLPLKLNMSGVMPIIFAQSIISVPATIAALAGYTSITDSTPIGWKVVLGLFGTDSFIYLILYIVLLILFAYFYINISFDPVEVSNNLKKNGGFVPGIRPGRPTAEFIRKILNRVTLIGAVFLVIISSLPLLFNCVASIGVDAFAGIAFSGSSLLICVGICLETARAIEAQMTVRNFKGFLE